jgi:hypothetical protein
VIHTFFLPIHHGKFDVIVYYTILLRVFKMAKTYKMKQNINYLRNCILLESVQDNTALLEKIFSFKSSGFLNTFNGLRESELWEKCYT